MGQVWTEEMDKFLIENYLKMKFENIAKILNVSKNAVYYRTKILNISFKKSPKWTEKELNFLKENFNTMCTIQMSKILKRSKQAIRDKSYELKLNKGGLHHKNDYEIIDDNSVAIIIYTPKGVIKTLIDYNDLEKCSAEKWNYDYIRNEVRNTSNIKLHRFIMDEYNMNIKIDHINGDRLNNKKNNLRRCNDSENMQNRTKLSINNTSGHRAVYFDKKKNKWYTRLCIDNIKRFIGYFDTKDECIEFAKYMRAYKMPFSKEAMEIPQEDIPQWIKDRIDERLNK